MGVREAERSGEEGFLDGFRLGNGREAEGYLG
jgi:hypothetical protein